VHYADLLVMPTRVRNPASQAGVVAVGSA
jgi:hypothetical protein